MQGSSPSVVAGVEGGKQLPHFLPAALAEHEPVRTHPQGLAHQPGESNLARALEIRLPDFQ